MTPRYRACFEHAMKQTGEVTLFKGPLNKQGFTRSQTMTVDTTDSNPASSD